MKQWTVYCHIHTDSGRRYIGLTSQSWKQRWEQHVYASKDSRDGRWLFPNAIRKFGKNSFSHEILDICDTLEEANASEEKWIKHFDSRNPKKGFNIAQGGKHAPHVREKPTHPYVQIVDWSATHNKHGEVENNYSFVCIECIKCYQLVDLRVDSLKRYIRKNGLNYECFECKNHDEFSVSLEERLSCRDPNNPSNVICRSCSKSYAMTDKSLNQKIRNKKRSGGLIQCSDCAMKDPEYVTSITELNQQNAESLSKKMKEKWQDSNFRFKYECLWKDPEYKNKISTSLKKSLSQLKCQTDK